MKNRTGQCALALLLAVCLAGAALAPAFAAVLPYCQEDRTGGVYAGDRHWAVRLTVSEASDPAVLSAAYTPGDFGDGVRSVVVLADSTVTKAETIRELQMWLDLYERGDSPPDDANEETAEAHRALLRRLTSGFACDVMLLPEDPANRDSAEALYGRILDEWTVRGAAAGTVNVTFSKDFDLKNLSTSYGQMLPGLVPEAVRMVSMRPEEVLFAGEYALTVGVYKPLDPVFPYDPNDFGWAGDPVELSEEEASLMSDRSNLPHTGYTAKDLGLTDADVREIRPTYALLSSRFVDSLCVFPADASLAGARAAAERVRATDGVCSVFVVPKIDALTEFSDGHTVLVTVAPDFDIRSAGPETFGEQVELVAADEWNVSDPAFRMLRLYLKEPSRDAVIALVRSFSEKPFIRNACANTAFSMDAFLVGDADMDGHVTAADARLVLRFAVGLEKPVYAYSASVAHTDGDGQYTAADARKILRVAVGLEREEFVS